MPKVVFVKEKQEIEVPEGANLREEARKAAIPVYQGFDRYANCRGLGMCGTCKVLVQKGKENLSPKSLRERARLALSFSSIGHEDDMRLSCQTKVLGDCEIVTTPELDLSGENFWQRPYPNK
jgi:ferredoxin